MRIYCPYCKATFDGEFETCSLCGAKLIDREKLQQVTNSYNAGNYNAGNYNSIPINPKPKREFKRKFGLGIVIAFAGATVGGLICNVLLEILSAMNYIHFPPSWNFWHQVFYFVFICSGFIVDLILSIHDEILKKPAPWAWIVGPVFLTVVLVFLINVLIQ